MTVPCKALFAISCISFSLHAMEDVNLTTLSITKGRTQSNAQNLDNYNLKNTFYKKASSILDKDPHDTENIKVIIDFITKTEKHSSQVSPKEIGKFAYNQPTQDGTSFSITGSSYYYGPRYISVFFARLAQYHTLIKKMNDTSPTISPTLEQFLQDKQNKKIDSTIENASHIGIFLDINQARELTISIPSEVAITEFNQFIGNIAAIRYIKPEEIKQIADLIYKHDL